MAIKKKIFFEQHVLVQSVFIFLFVLLRSIKIVLEMFNFFQRKTYRQRDDFVFTFFKKMYHDFLINPPLSRLLLQ